MQNARHQAQMRRDHFWCCVAYQALGLCLWGAVLSARAVTQAELMVPARRTLDLVYNMEFDQARQAAQDVIAQAPEHPAGYFYRAVTYWQQLSITLTAPERERFFKQFDQASSQTLEVAQHLPASQATEMAFYLGAVYGMRARMHFVQKHYFKALQAAKQGAAYLQQCVAHDPAWDDAYAGLGTYHYVLSRIPAIWRGIVQHLIGIQGDRELGLRELERARTQGLLSGPEATSLLAKIYTLSYEKRYRQAYTFLDELVRRYPNNFDYRYRLAYVAALMGRWQRAQQLYHHLTLDIEPGHPYYQPQWLPVLHYRMAETYVLQGNHQAASRLLEALQQQPIGAALHDWVRLRLGNVSDLRGARQAALAWYRQINTEAQAVELAQAYVNRPFTPGRGKLKKPDETI